MDFLCILCKQIVNQDAQDGLKLDPCGLEIIAHITGEEAQREEQLFYCHFACFRRLVGDDNLLKFLMPEAQDAPHVEPFAEDAQPNSEHIQDALQGFQTDFAPDDLPLIEARLARLVRDVELYGEKCGLWERLLAVPRGRWVALANLTGTGNEIYTSIAALDPFMKPREDILVTWVDDYYNRSRPFENNRLVLLALDSGYTWMRQIIIPLERPDRPNPGLIP